VSGIHQRAELRRDVEKERKIKNGGDRVAAIIEGKNYELIDRNESRYRRGDRLRRVDRGRNRPGVAKAEPRRMAGSIFGFSLNSQP
jgi:hypothetical protein